MSRNAQPRRRSSNSRTTSWLTGGLLIAGLTIAGVYCLWGDAPLEKTWVQLGFGKQTPEARPSDQAAAEIPAVDPVDVMRLPKAEPAMDGFEQSAANFEADSESSRFLPDQRAGVAVAQRSNPFEEGVADAGLDQRFDQETLARKTASIRTAAFADPVDHAGSTNPSEQFASGREVIQEPSRELPPQRQSRDRQFGDSASRIQLLAGEDGKPKVVARRPARPNIPASPVTASPGSNALDLDAIQELLDRGQDAEAYHMLSDAYFQHASQRPLFQKQLDEVAQRIYFSPQTQIQPPYEIQPGDQLRKIALKYNLSWQYLCRLNQVDARKIRPGKKLKVFQGPFEARVDLSDFELTILLNGQYVKRYQVGVGKMNTTPIGEFTVREKLENPTYYGPDGLVMQADDPLNPLGERWIDIGNSFGIHGTIEPDSIGKSESAGCVRMRNDDVAEVYDLLTVGSVVHIQR